MYDKILDTPQVKCFDKLYDNYLESRLKIFLSWFAMKICRIKAILIWTKLFLLNFQETKADARPFKAGACLFEQVLVYC